MIGFHRTLAHSILAAESLPVPREWPLYSIVNHILVHHCISAISRRLDSASYVAVPQPAFEALGQICIPDFATFINYKTMARPDLGFIWEVKEYSARLGTEELAKEMAITEFGNDVPQLNKYALIAFQAHPDIDKVHIFYSKGPYFSYLVYNKPSEVISKLSPEDAAEFGHFLTQDHSRVASHAPLSTDTKHRINISLEGLIEVYQKALTPTVEFFFEDMFLMRDNTLTLSAHMRDALERASKHLGTDNLAMTRTQKSWFKRGPNEDVTPWPGSIERAKYSIALKRQRTGDEFREAIRVSIGYYDVPYKKEPPESVGYQPARTGKRR
ncbi:hypothetical protein OF83DRAFT_1193873 [Amylostereum chailletii]|nr:hypothetical protein OF83DRAFT_1193873 [Amylostereum chailletii]